MIKVDPIERHLFFEGVLLRYGYDFRQYAEASLDRRLVSLMNRYQTQSLVDILKITLNDAEEFRRIVSQLTINTTEFFRDPKFFRALREVVFPVLKTYSKVNIWSAGCSTGEEVLSLAIALKEEGLGARSTIFATDLSPMALKAAKDGIYESGCIAQFNKNYSLAGGAKSPSDYYTSEYGLVRFNRDLIEHVVFSPHNLATDGAFVEAHLILCRNVFIYFNRELQNRALELFTRSLVHKGFLGLGSKETLRFSTSARFFSNIGTDENIFSFNPLSPIKPEHSPSQRDLR